MSQPDGFYGNFPSQQGNAATDFRVSAPTEFSAANLPTADPKVKGALWNSTGTVTVSNG